MDQPSLKAVLGQAQAFFASKGLRFTKQREAVTTLIFRTHEHFRPEELCERLRKSDSSASRATIYRTILHLVESGMLREISLGGGERLYDPNFLQSPHHNHVAWVSHRRKRPSESRAVAICCDSLAAARTCNHQENHPAGQKRFQPE